MAKPKITPAEHIYDRMIYDAASPVAELMLKVDSQWFREHPEQTVMFRHAVDGESPILDLLRARGEGDGFWLLVERIDGNRLVVRPVHELNGIRSILHSAKEPMSESIPFFDINEITEAEPAADPQQKGSKDVVH